MGTNGGAVQFFGQGIDDELKSVLFLVDGLDRKDEARADQEQQGEVGDEKYFETFLFPFYSSHQDV